MIRTSTLAAALLLSTTIAGNGQTTTTLVANDVPECPAFDVVQRRILEVTRGSDGQEITPEDTAAVAVEIIFDASGSMAGRIGGDTKLSLAKDALELALGRLDQTSAMVGLRAYGFDTSVDKTEAASCPNTALISSFATDAAPAHRRAVRGLSAYGYTPIAASLAAAGIDLAALEARDRMIILISDGEETCGGDPVQTAADLNAQGVALSTNVVGFDLDADQRAQMQAIAQAGGGAYFDARDKASLARAIDDAVGVTVRKQERVIEKCINPLLGGPTLETAVPVEPGLYTIGELLEKSEGRYYRIASEAGQRVVIRGLLQSRRNLPDAAGNAVETDYALGAFTIAGVDANEKPVGSRPGRVRDLPGTSARFEYLDTDGTGVTLRIGDNYDYVAPDTLFAIDLVPAADGDVADASEDRPATLIPEFPITGHIGLDDAEDTWILPAIPGVSRFAVRFAPELADFRHRIRLASVKDGASRRLSGETIGEELIVELPADAEALSLRIENREPKSASRFTSYQLSVGAAAP